MPAEQGYPAGLADPSKFNPLTANITYMPPDFHSSPVQSWYISVQRELRHNMLLDVAYVGNRADDLLLFANYNQAFAEQCRRDHPAAGPASEPGYSPTSPTPSTAASRATRRCRPSSSGA